MRTTIDAAGRVVIPKALRERLGLVGGRAVEVRERDGHLEIEAAATPMRLVKRRSVLTAVADEPLPPLTNDTVRATIERTRR
jgi:AbrB family looped-hinge helix DNA binding protein